MPDGHIDQVATTYDVRERFDYENFRFSDAFPIPAMFLVVAEMGLFRGPDTCLWFAPLLGDGHTGTVDWDCPQNMARVDFQQETGEDSFYRKPWYQQSIADICHTIDALTIADGRFTRLFESWR
jgi:hypothetical protein